VAKKEPKREGTELRKSVVIGKKKGKKPATGDAARETADSRDIPEKPPKEEEGSGRCWRGEGEKDWNGTAEFSRYLGERRKSNAEKVRGARMGLCATGEKNEKKKNTVRLTGSHSIDRREGEKTGKRGSSVVDEKRE